MGVRSFIALEIPAPVRTAVGSAIDSLGQSGADVKWVGRDNIHITLKFLGDVDEDRLPSIEAALAKKLTHYQPFYIRIIGIGSFPPGRHPRVIWAGIVESAVLNSLQKDVEREMAAAGFPAEDRPFSAHLTIGRVRSGRKLADLVKRLNESGDLSFGDFEVRGVRLMKSELRPTGPVYTCLAEIPLTGRADV